MQPVIQNGIWQPREWVKVGVGEKTERLERQEDRKSGRREVRESESLEVRKAGRPKVGKTGSPKVRKVRKPGRLESRKLKIRKSESREGVHVLLFSFRTFCPRDLLAFLDAYLLPDSCVPGLSDFRSPGLSVTKWHIRCIKTVHFQNQIICNLLLINTNGYWHVFVTLYCVLLGQPQQQQYDRT